MSTLNMFCGEDWDTSNEYPQYFVEKTETLLMSTHNMFCGEDCDTSNEYPQNFVEKTMTLLMSTHVLWRRLRHF